jgi:hypothetical protein
MPYLTKHITKQLLLEDHDINSNYEADFHVKKQFVNKSSLSSHFDKWEAYFLVLVIARPAHLQVLTQIVLWSLPL